MEILEQIYTLDEKYPRFVPHLHRLKEFGLLGDILSSASRNLTCSYRVKREKIYSKKRVKIRKASLHPTQRKLLNY